MERLGSQLDWLLSHRWWTAIGAIATLVTVGLFFYHVDTKQAPPPGNTNKPIMVRRTHPTGLSRLKSRHKLAADWLLLHKWWMPVCAGLAVIVPIVLAVYPFSTKQAPQPVQAEQKQPSAAAPPMPSGSPQIPSFQSPICKRVLDAQVFFNMNDSIHQVQFHTILQEIAADANKSGATVDEHLLKQARTEWVSGNRPQALQDFVGAFACE